MRIVLCTCLLLSLYLSADTALGNDLIIGGDAIYVVQKEDTLQRIGAKHGVFWKKIASDNNLDIKQVPPAGTILKINTRRIVPKVVENGIIINVPDRTLYFFKDGKLSAFPVGLGLLAKNEAGDWKTPMGKFYVVRKRKNPTWTVPPSIQLENEIKGKPVEEVVPPGPNNPLGQYAIDTSIPGVLIHGTIKPGSVYRYMSHGCIRVLPEHIEQLYPMVDIKTQGEIIYEPVKIAVTETGRVFLEVRTDVYKKYRSTKSHAAKVIESYGVSERVDWQKVDRLIAGEGGVAEDVTLDKPPIAVAAPGTTVAKNEPPGIARRIMDYFRSYLKKS